MQASTATPPVLVVLVAHDGARWLPRTLAALDDQDHPALEVVAVDNGSTDATRELLLEHLGSQRLLVAERDLGFGAAVAMALDARPRHDAEYLLLLHDDVALEPDAARRLVEELEGDPHLAAVGPKLREWDDGDRLQSVGWTIDLTGRADSGVDEGELDQGQRDEERRSLYVSTAGMVVRRALFDELGRFDRRFHIFRDDLDWCWRAWLAGYDVEAVPDAVGYHVAGATNYLRLGQTRFLGPRYFSERNTLATLLKNYAAPRLLLVVPVYFLVGVAKVLGFLLTRRVSDAWQTVRAWLWNALHLLETLRLRREVQRRRRRADAQLRVLFGRIVPRVRAYAEAIGDWVAGGDVAPVRAGPGPEATGTPVSALRRGGRFLLRRPVLLAGALLTLVVLVGAVPLLLPGTLRGGDLAPWPAGPGAFLVDYVRSWHEAGAFGTAQAPSPAQAILGLTQLLVLGSSWAAPRLVLLGALAAAWILGLRAAQVHSPRRPARVAAASAYVLSPPALAAVATGRLGGLALVGGLPGLVAAGTTALRPDTRPERAWRAVAGVVLMGALVGAFAPVVLPVLSLAALTAMAIALLQGSGFAWWRAVLARCLVAGLGPWLLLLPWSARLVLPDGPLFGVDGPVVTSSLSRWLLLAPDLPGLPGPVVGAGFVLAGLLGLALGLGRRPVLVAGLATVGVLASVLGWAGGRIGLLPWPALPLVIAAAAYAALLAVAFASAEAVLARHDFGWRHLAVAGSGLLVLASLGAVAATLVTGPWEAYAVDSEPLPAFVTSGAAEEDFRVLVLADRGGEVSWEVVDGHGPSMAAYGVEEPARTRQELRQIVEAALAGTDSGVSGRLGPLGVRYVVIPEGGASPELDAVLRQQLALEPRPVADGRVLRVASWVPPAVVVPEAAAQQLDQRGELPPQTPQEVLAHVDNGRYAGEVATPGRLLVAEAPHPAWEARADGTRLELDAGPGQATMHADVPTGAVELDVSHEGALGRRLAVAWQVLALLLTVSLALRPPGFARALREVRE